MRISIPTFLSNKPINALPKLLKIPIPGEIKLLDILSKKHQQIWWL